MQYHNHEQGCVLDSHSRVRELLHRAAGSPVVVLGAGVTGRAVAKVLASGGYLVTVVDEKALSAEARAELESERISVLERFDVQQQAPRSFEQRFSFAVLSPGIALDSPLVSFVARESIPCLSEIDLAIAYLGMPTVAVTGTNGKTTTVHLIYEMLKMSGCDTELVGNVGTPMTSLIHPSALSGKAEAKSSALLVAEVSSYQLESAFDFVPRIGVWLNVDDDHLERHKSIEEYVRIKSKIFSGQSRDSDWSLICIDDPWAERTRLLSKGKFFPFGRASSARLEEPRGCWFDARARMIFLDLGSIKEQYSLAKCRLWGGHNMSNLAAAVAAARLAGASEQSIQDVIDTFSPLPHRLELVTQKNGVTYLNDSKGTNVSAVRAAVATLRESTPHFSCILLVGGKAKMGTWKSLSQVLLPGVHAVIGFGADGGYALSQLDLKPLGDSGNAKEGVGQIASYLVDDLTQAVQLAHELARSGDIVLLSPGCSSFDAYRDYAHRGDHFRELVMGLSVSGTLRSSASS